jgi:DNA-binding transcriptional ArsR family regulator
MIVATAASDLSRIASRADRTTAVGIPRSDLLRRVLGSLRDHPHDDTVEQISRLLALAPDTVEVALIALEQSGLARQARTHWSLSHEGWLAARADDPYRESD